MAPARRDAALGVKPLGLLLNGLDDPNAAVRSASLEALVRLQIPDDVWARVGSYMVRTLTDARVADRDELKSCVECSSRVPLPGVREAVLSLASGPDEELAALAVDALLAAGDARAVPFLLRRLSGAGNDDRRGIAEDIARLDAAPYATTVDEAYSALVSKPGWQPEVAFWLALALARTHRPERMVELIAALAHDEGRPPLLMGSWMWPRLEAGGPLPRQALDAILEEAGKAPGWRTSDVTEALEHLAGAPSSVAAAKAKPVHPPLAHARRRPATTAVRPPSAAARAAVRALPVVAPSGRLRLRVAGAVGRLVGQPAMVSALFEQAAGFDDPKDVIAGNSIVEHVESEPGFEPDVPGLFHAYRLGANPDQIAWTASRMPMAGILEGINEHLGASDPAIRIDAAKFIASAADHEAEDRGPRTAWGKGSGGGGMVAEDTFEAAAPPPEAEPAGVEPDGIPPAAPSPPASDERFVSSGFAGVDTADDPLPVDRSLAAGSTYWYWFEIGELPASGRIEDSPAAIDISKLPEQALLTVVLFPVAGGLELTGGSSGTLRLDRSGQISVEAQPSGAPTTGSRLSHRLFFAVRTPAGPGTYAMRVSMYCNNVLVQSRRVTVVVGVHEGHAAQALRATVDYTISSSLDFAYIASRRANRMCLMVNSLDDGTHGFLFAAGGQKDGYYCPAWIGEGEIDSFVVAVRQALRMAAYGSEGNFDEAKDKYRYAEPNIDKLSEDIKALARAGKRVHASIVSRLACNTAAGADPADHLVALMRTPGLVEIANKISPTLVLPAAVIYDQPLDDAIDSSRLSICPDFLAALSAGADLAKHPCFNTECTSKGDDKVVCPGNFWGFRHSLGLPVSVAAPSSSGENKAREAAPFISFDAMPRFDIGFATGTDLVLRDDHLKWIEESLSVTTSQAGTREDAFTLFKSSQPHVFYFYCHGGLSQSMIPFLQVGGPDEDLITPNNVSDRVRWAGTRPLVFINGCHTTALEPTQAIQFVTAFVENGHASGVIGTEVTVFEPLAISFAQEFFSRVLLEDMCVGEAVRAARLTLLAQMNPLGLAYVPFVAPDLEFKKSPAAAP
jgi:hypothetical protein